DRSAFALSPLNRSRVSGRRAVQPGPDGSPGDVVFHFFTAQPSDDSPSNPHYNEHTRIHGRRSMTMRPRALGLFVLTCLCAATAAVAAQTPEPPPDAARLGLQAAIETVP